MNPARGVLLLVQSSHAPNRVKCRLSPTAFINNCKSLFTGENFLRGESMDKGIDWNGRWAATIGQNSPVDCVYFTKCKDRSNIFIVSVEQLSHPFPIPADDFLQDKE